MKLSRSSRYRGVPATYEYKKDAVNHYCGDELCLYLAYDADKVSLHYEGEACAICLASSALMAEHINGLTQRQAQQIPEQVLSCLSQQQDIELGEEFTYVVEKVRSLPVRIQCASLCWNALHPLLNSQPENQPSGD